MGRREAEFPNEPQTIGDLMAPPHPQGALMTPSQTKLLEDLRSGAVRLVPVEATDEMTEHSARAIHDTEDMCDTVWPDHENDDGYRGDRAYVRICQWPDLYRNAARYAHSAMLSASPDHTPALLALIEERDKARARALAAHAETRAFWDALVPKGPRCRDCADFDGRCQGDGPPCAPQEHALENLAKLIAERDRLKVERDEAREQAQALQLDAVAELMRANAAEAERDALREALAPFGSGAVVFYENEPDDCVLSLGRWKYQEDGRARFYADVQFTVADVRRARALTQEQADGE